MLIVTESGTSTRFFLPLLMAACLCGCTSSSSAPTVGPAPPINAVADVAVMDRFKGRETKDAFVALGTLGGRLLTRYGVQLLGIESGLLLDLDLEGTRSQPLVVTHLHGVASGVKLGGLAAAPDGRWWTVRERTDLALITARGEVSTVETLPFAAFALYSWQEMLLAQVARAGPGESPFMGKAGAGEWQSVGPLKTREHASKLESLLWNTAHCGASRADHLPCWFLLGEPDVVLVDNHGTWNRCPLVLPAGTGGQVSGAGSTYPTSFRDLFVSGQDEIITLADTGTGDENRGRFLGRYSLQGELLAGVHLNRGARQVLDVRRGKVFLLLVGDSIGEVTLP